MSKVMEKGAKSTERKRISWKVYIR